MAEGGEPSDRDPLVPDDWLDNDDDDDDDAYTTQPFQPGAASTPGPVSESYPMTTMNRPPERGPNTAETSFIEGDAARNAYQEKRDSILKKAQEDLRMEYPNYDGSIELTYEDGEVSGYRESKTKKADTATEKIYKKAPRGGGIFQKKILNAFAENLGDSRDQIEQQITALREGINTNKQIADDSGKSETERNDARERAKRQIEAREKLQTALDTTEKREEIELQDLRAQREERTQMRDALTKQNEEDREVANDKNEQSSIRERARERIQEREQEIDEIDKEVARIDKKLSLRERMKEIFKKYGFTVVGVLAAVGTVIGVIVNSLSNGLKKVANGVGNGLQALGKKIGSILPGLLGAIVSFVFRTAGHVISFLGKNAWLLILAVAMFLIERVSKRD